MPIAFALNRSYGLRDSQRHTLDRAQTVSLLMRNGVTAIAAGVGLAQPSTAPEGRALLAVAACWSLYRISSRSSHRATSAIDYASACSVGVAIPLLAPGPSFHLSNSVPQVIAGTAVVSFAISLPATASLLTTVGIATAYAYGSAAVLGWGAVASVGAIYYFGLQWVTGALIRGLLLRVAAAVDLARAQRSKAEAGRRVGEAIRHYGREQVALLHDTAASTLLMVSLGTPITGTQLRGQARRDLLALEQHAHRGSAAQINVISDLRDCAERALTPVRFSGLRELWLDLDCATAVAAAAREAITNVDRHAAATSILIVVDEDSVVIADDGIGFDDSSGIEGFGLTQSIVGRMLRIGGHAQVSSSPGMGTVIELRWPATPGHWVGPDEQDPDSFIGKMRVRFALALTAYAFGNLVFAVAPAAAIPETRPVTLAFALVTAAATIAAVPNALRQRWRLVPWACTALLAVAVLQPALLEPARVGGYAHWAQSVIGWCLLPQLLGLRTRFGLAILVGYWLVGALVQFAVAPASPTLINIGLGSASILGVQVSALIFNGLIREAASDAFREQQVRAKANIEQTISAALSVEYRHRYSTVIEGVRPILLALSEGREVDDNLRGKAKVESRRLRVLFDQSVSFEHPLMASLRPLIDDAEERQVAVTVALSGVPPALDPDITSALLAPVSSALKYAGSSVRVAISSNRGTVSVSVVYFGRPPSIESLRGDCGVTVDVICSDDQVWVRVGRQIKNRGGDNDL